MNNEINTKAREILLKHALASVDKHGYLPTTDKEALNFLPHDWANKSVVEALQISQKESAKNIHGEVHKLASIMEREFGDSVGRFLRMYAAQINNDFNNKAH